MSSFSTRLASILELLDPPVSSSERLTVESVATAHELLLKLQDEEEMWSSSTRNHPEEDLMKETHTEDGNSQKKRVTFDLSSQTTTTRTMEHRADLYRAVLVASYLWLELGPPTDLHTLETLQHNVERSLLLLQVLACIINPSSCTSETDWPQSLPPSCEFPLLDAVLSEPWVPINWKERQDLYAWQRQQLLYSGDSHIKRKPYSVEEEEEEEEFVIPSKAQLRREEQALVQLALTPIPLAQEIEKTTETPPLPPNPHTHPDKVLVWQGPLEWCLILDDGTPTQHSEEDAAAWQAGTAQVHAGGTVILTTHEDEVVVLLTPNSTCQPQKSDSRDCDVLVTNCRRQLSSSTDTTTPTTTTLSLRFGSLQEGYECVTLVETRVLPFLIKIQRLHRRLQEEWNGGFV